MFLRDKVSCPSCQGVRCRRSRWLSPAEKQRHQVNSPYRCLDCSCRFLSPTGSTLSKGLVVSMPAALVAVVLAIAATFWLASVGTPPESSAPALPSALDPELRKAAAAGDVAAQFRLGEALLHDTTGGAESSADALRWMQTAAENGNTQAMIVLGRLSRTGVGILQNFGQSATWLQTAAARGDPEGMLELGRLYRDGVGVEKNLVRAYVWFNRASAARNLDAVREREAVARVLTFEELKEAQKQSSAPDADREKSAGTSASKG